MKPRNFPERKRQRQLEAIGRGRLSPEQVSRLVEAIGETRRGIRSKKDRSANAGFRSRP